MADGLPNREAVTGRTTHRNHAPAGPGIVPAFSEKPFGSRFDNAHFDALRFGARMPDPRDLARSEEHTSELQSLTNLVCRLLLEKKNNTRYHVSGSAGVLSLGYTAGRQ